MVYVAVKIAVGTLLMADYSVPLLVVLLRRSLWDEPMVLLVANLCALNFAFGLSLSSIGVLDLLWQPPPAVPCAALMAATVGSAVSVKLTHACLALDQYVAISRPLHYYALMERLAGRFVLFSWLWAALHTVAGLTASLAGLETPAQLAERVSNASSQFTGCRWERVVPGSFMMVTELEAFLCCICTSSIFIYAGYVGWREKRRMEVALAPSRRLRAPPEASFLANFSVFKRVLRLMLLVLTLDVVGSVLRLSSWWYLTPQLNGLIHQLRLSLGVVEGWVYGLQNGKMRAAYADALGCCCGGWLSGGGRVLPHQEQHEEEQQGRGRPEEDGGEAAENQPRFGGSELSSVNIIPLAVAGVGRADSQGDEEGQRQVEVAGNTTPRGQLPSVIITAWTA